MNCYLQVENLYNIKKVNKTNQLSGAQLVCLPDPSVVMAEHIWKITQGVGYFILIIVYIDVCVCCEGTNRLVYCNTAPKCTTHTPTETPTPTNKHTHTHILYTYRHIHMRKQ